MPNINFGTISDIECWVYYQEYYFKLMDEPNNIQACFEIHLILSYIICYCLKSAVFFLDLTLRSLGIQGHAHTIVYFYITILARCTNHDISHLYCILKICFTSICKLDTLIIFHKMRRQCWNKVKHNNILYKLCKLELNVSDIIIQLNR